MKLIDNILYIETPDLVAAGFNINTIYSICRHGYATLPFVKDPANAKLNIYPYEQLGKRYKDAVDAHFGNPYNYVAKAPIRNAVKHDHKAEEFYLAYRYDGTKHLPTEHVVKYTKAASWLNMLIEMNTDKKAIKKQLGLTLESFWQHVCELIKTEKVDLPTSYKRLRISMQEFQEAGYAYLIDWRFGNKLAAKVNDEVSAAILLELIAHPNQHDDYIICQAYNQWAVANNYKPIDPATVGVHRRNNRYQLEGQRNGNSSWYNTYGKVIHRARPSAPLLLVGSDDNDLDLYFRDDRRGKTNPYYRYKLIVIMDAYNDYILGYSYGETVTTDLIKAAYLDAVYHIRQLTGGWYLMDQIQTDRWGSGSLNSFYQSVATYTPATAKVARAKYIERAFGTEWHQVLKMYPNYAGQNITSQFRLNRDHLEVAKRDFPTIEQGYQYIDDFINRLRQLPNRKTGISRQQQWLNAFNSSDLSRQHQISEGRMLHLFGQQHSHSHTITNGGLRVNINGQQFVYDVPDELYLQNVGKKVQVTYDPYDYSRVLVTDGGSLRFVAREFDKMSSALADYKPGDRARLNQLLQQKRRHVEAIAASKEKRQDAIERAGIDAASMLQAQVMVKELKQTAELTYQQVANGGHYDPLDQM